ncbi:MAG: DMT family transporter, partial [Muribaculaceae bacterium]|nr:DMT family transporter [Muribaculaceae bacterium]
MNVDLKGHASMFGANAVWGVMSPIAKFVMISGTITPLVVTNLRIAGAMILFWLVSLFMKPEQVGSKDMAKLFGASLLAIVFNQGCFIIGLGRTSPVNASIITTSMPLWAMVLAAFFLKEPITGKKIMGIASGAAGAVLLILGGHSASQTGGVASSIWGDLMVVTAQFSYALYIVLFKDFVSRYSLFTVMKWMFTFAFICLVPFSTQELSQTNWDAVTRTEWAALALVVIGATFVCYILVVIGQRRLRPTVAGMYNYIQPLVACIVAI